MTLLYVTDGNTLAQAFHAGYSDSGRLRSLCLGEVSPQRAFCIDHQEKDDEERLRHFVTVSLVNALAHRYHCSNARCPDCVRIKLLFNFLLESVVKAVFRLKCFKSGHLQFTFGDVSCKISRFAKS